MKLSKYFIGTAMALSAMPPTAMAETFTASSWISENTFLGAGIGHYADNVKEATNGDI